MKKFLAVTLTVVTMAVSGWAQVKADKAFVNRAGVKEAAAQVRAVAALTTTAGYVPVFTDNAGTLGDSSIFQANGLVGIGTLTPATTLDVSGTNPTLRVDNYSNTLGDSPNFNFVSARGTAAAPGATQSGDNLGQFAAAGYNGSAFPSSRVKVTFIATENWTTTNNGTAMAFLTTKNGTASRAERMRIDNTGNVGIGTTTPANPLSVNGVVQSMTGGFMFPDGSKQITAVTPGVALTSPDSSITVAGTPVAPTVVVNTGAIQKRVTGTCTAGSALTTVNADGTVACGSVGPAGSLAKVPLVVANTTFNGGYGLGATQTIYTASTSGFYRVSVYMNVPTTGTCSSIPCAGEQIAVQWSDGVSSTALSTTTCDLTAVCGATKVIPVWVSSGQAITAYGQPWGTGSAPTGGSYNAYVLVEQL